MNAEELRSKAVSATLRTMDKPPKSWVTHNDRMNSEIVSSSNFKSKALFELLENELPIFQCDLMDSVALITTRRAVSFSKGQTDYVFFEDFVELSNDCSKENFKKTNGRLPKTQRLCIEGRMGNRVDLIIDSYYPFYFARVLLRNLVSVINHKKWYLNPGFPKELQ